MTWLEKGYEEPFNPGVLLSPIPGHRSAASRHFRTNHFVYQPGRQNRAGLRWKMGGAPAVSRTLAKVRATKQGQSLCLLLSDPNHNRR